MNFKRKSRIDRLGTKVVIKEKGVTYETFDMQAFKSAKKEGIKDAIAMLKASKLDAAIDILTPLETVDYCIDKLELLIDGK